MLRRPVEDDAAVDTRTAAAERRRRIFRAGVRLAGLADYAARLGSPTLSILVEDHYQIALALALHPRET